MRKLQNVLLESETTMWKPNPSNEPADGIFRYVRPSGVGDNQAFSIDARGGKHGIKLACGGSTSDSAACFSFEAVGSDEVPELAEQFVRGDELHLVYPQQQGSYTLRLVLQPIALTGDTLVIEAILAIQTDLLDTHPMIDLVSSIESLERSPGDAGSKGTDSKCAGEITLGQRSGCSVAALLGPHDSPFASDQSSDREIRLRLFGEFLEKGVIRKARPWLVMKTGDETVTMSDLRARWMELASSPLPLTP